MITLTRRQARTLRSVFRRSVLGIPHRRPIPPLVFRTDDTLLRVQHRYVALGVEHVLVRDSGPPEALALPLDALADFEGPDETPVTLEALSSDRTIARWTDRGIPQAREYPVDSVDSLVPFPLTPTSWSEVPGTFLDALAEASSTTEDDNKRYALECVQIRERDGAHEVVATDGRQLFLQGGFALPWSGDMLIRRSPVFACRALSGASTLSVGRSTTHVVLRIGFWTLFHAIQTEARFPRVDSIIPAASFAATRVRFAPADVQFLRSALDRLPGTDALNSPCTLDLNGRIALRASGENAPPTELILSRSHYDGPPVRVCTNRAFLARALQLGFTTLEIADPSTPLACRDSNRVYGWQPLDADAALAPDANATRLDSTWNRDVLDPPTPRPRERHLMPRTPEVPDAAPVRAPELSPPDAAKGSGLSALITEAEALQTILTDARTRAAKLVVAVRRHRKRERLVQTTLASLREIRLQDVNA